MKLIHVVRQHPAWIYFGQIPGKLIEAALLLLSTGFACVIVLYTSRIFWHVYLETPMGISFLQIFPEQARAVSEIFSRDVAGYSIELTLTSFFICMIVGACSRFFFISRHFYLSMGLFGKLLCWGLPLTAAVDYHIHGNSWFVNIEITFFLTAVPTLLVFMSCFRLSSELIPEISTVFGGLWNFYDRIYRKITGHPAPDIHNFLNLPLVVSCRMKIYTAINNLRNRVHSQINQLIARFK